MISAHVPDRLVGSLKNMAWRLSSLKEVTQSMLKGGASSSWMALDRAASKSMHADTSEA